MTLLQQRACFACRKSFKTSQPAGEPAKCPQCAGPLFTMGTAFRAPKQTDVAQWKKVEQLIRTGYLFHRNAGPRPQALRDVPEFLASSRKKSPGEKLLHRRKGVNPHGRIVTAESGGKTEFTLLGEPLAPWCMIEVIDQGEWQHGVFKSRPKPHIRTDSGTTVTVQPNTVCRWPRQR